nr:hypothetical protein [uncultured Flavobacterium sp.]
MKKNLFYFLAVSAAFLTSCANDVVEVKDKSKVILPKTIKYTNSVGSSEFTINYNNNKIVSIVGKNERTDYTYEGNFITKEIKYNTTGGKKVKLTEYSYSYSNGKLASTNFAKRFSDQFPNGDYKERSVYTFNADGNAVVKSYYTDLSSEENKNERELETVVLSFDNGNLIKKVSELSLLSGLHYAETRVDEYKYEYDTNNNPFKNVLGFDLLMKDVFVNNVIKTTISSVLPNGSYLNTDTTKTNYIYNVNGYPTKVTSSGVIEYTY